MSQPQNAERDARLMAQLDDATARLLFPERFAEPLTVTLVHPPLQGAAAAEAAALAGRHLQFAADRQRPGNPQVQRATFTLDRAQALHDYYALLEAQLAGDQVEVLIGGKRVPMVLELWLPLLWLLRS